VPLSKDQEREMWAWTAQGGSASVLKQFCPGRVDKITELRGGLCCPRAVHSLQDFIMSSLIVNESSKPISCDQDHFKRNAKMESQRWRHMFLESRWAEKQDCVEGALP